MIIDLTGEDAYKDAYVSAVEVPDEPEEEEDEEDEEC